MSSPIELKHIAESLTKGLHNKRKSLKALATIVGASSPVLSNLFSGKLKSNPNLSLVKKVCDELDLVYREVIYKSPSTHIKPGLEPNDILKILMNETALSNLDLSIMLGFSRQYISQVLKTGKGSTKFYDQAAAVFGLTYEQITGVSHINLDDVSTFFFENIKKEIDYPLLQDHHVGFIQETYSLDSHNRKTSGVDLGEKGYFYKVPNDDSMYFIEGQILGIRFPDKPNETDHVIMYDIRTNIIHIVNAQEQHTFPNAVFRGTVVVM